MTGRNRLTDRGAYAKAPTKLPALAAARCEDPAAQRAIEALREWVEVRLGSRGDAFERALTLREFEQRLQPITDALAVIAGFNGGIETLKSTPGGLPTAVTNGSFRETSDGKLYYGMAGVWRQVTLT